MKRLIIITIFVFAAIVLSLPTCAKKDELEGFEVIEEEEITDEYRETVEEEEISEGDVETKEEVQKEGITHGIVTYLSGVVSIYKGSSWEILDVDNFVKLDNRVKTEDDSFCEIRYGHA